MFDAQATAERFVRARLDATTLPAYPGEIPPDLAAAYACQDAAIRFWPDAVAGWKVGRIASPWLEKYGEERLVGPIFRKAIRRAGAGEVVDVPVFRDGFAAVEAEFVIRLGADAPPERVSWTADAAAELVDALHLGVEPASSPLPTINDLGPAVIVSDFGNNAGLLLGPEIPDWRNVPAEALVSETFINDRSVGRGSAASVPGGPLAALAFALGCCARRGFPLRKGDLVSTGESTGIHRIRIGEHARVVFGDRGEIRCRAVEAVKGTFG